MDNLVYRDRLTALRFLKAQLESDLKQLESDRSDLLALEAAITEAIDYLAKLLEFKSKDSLTYITELVNDGLRSIFTDQDISIKFISSVKNNKLQYELVILNNGIEGSKESFGGGVLAVIAMILRFALSYKLNLAKLMVFDESLSFVSAQYRDNVSAFLQAIATRFGYSIVLISHDFGANKVYEVVKSGDASKVIEA